MISLASLGTKWNQLGFRAIGTRPVPAFVMSSCYDDDDLRRITSLIGALQGIGGGKNIWGQ